MPAFCNNVFDAGGGIVSTLWPHYAGTQRLHSSAEDGEQGGEHPPQPNNDLYLPTQH